jgi:hypothetical protein
MQVIWEADDITAGRRMKRNESAEEWILGYEFNDKKKYHNIISLNDGMVLRRFETKEECAKHLNVWKYIPSELFPKSGKQK